MPKFDVFSKSRNFTSLPYSQEHVTFPYSWPILFSRGCLDLQAVTVYKTLYVFIFRLMRDTCPAHLILLYSSSSNGSTPLGGLGRLIFRGFTITLFRHTTFGRTPLDEGPARRRDLYLTAHNTHKRQTSMPPLGFEPAIPVSERPQTHALDRTATGIGILPY
jgi:hypothetical protein